LRLNSKHSTILGELFPRVWERQTVQKYIAKHQKPE